MKKFTKKQKIILGVLIGLFLIFLIAGNNFLDKNIKGEVSLLGVGIDKDVMQLMISNIKKDVGNIEVKYTEVSEEKYLEKLKSSFSLGEENYDIVMIKNDMLQDLKGYLEPFVISEEEVKTMYFDTVFRDFYADGKLYAQPIYIDSLALYYNRNILNKKGVFNVPVVWEDLIELVSKIKEVDEFGDIKLSGINMGSAYNISHSVDILSLLMMQYGTRIYDGQNAIFANPIFYNNRDIIPGEKALDFYTQFSNAGIGNKYYTWNAGLNKDIDLFASGKLAFYIGTGMDRWKIEDKNPNLDYGISFMPQFENSPYEANLATYYALGVNKFSDDVYLAQKVVNYLGTKEISYIVMDTYKLAPALRSLISFCSNENYQNIFCSQVVNSYNWLKPVYSSSRQVFKDMIDNVSVRGSNSYDMVKAGQEYITNIKVLEND